MKTLNTQKAVARELANRNLLFNPDDLLKSAYKFNKSIAKACAVRIARDTLTFVGFDPKPTNDDDIFFQILDDADAFLSGSVSSDVLSDSISVAEDVLDDMPESQPIRLSAASTALVASMRASRSVILMELYNIRADAIYLMMKSGASRSFAESQTLASIVNCLSETNVRWESDGSGDSEFQFPSPIDPSIPPANPKGTSGFGPIPVADVNTASVQPRSSQPAVNRKLTDSKQREILSLLESGIIRPEQKIFVLFDKLDEKILARDLGKVRSDQGVYAKPRGLWYACGNEWLEWCAGNYFNPGQYVYEVIVDPRSNMLRLDSDKLVARFTETYGDARYGMDDRIDWTRVAGDFSGIEVCPYPLDMPEWLTRWDVASGCIWDLSAISGTRFIHRFKT